MEVAGHQQQQAEAARLPEGGQLRQKAGGVPLHHRVQRHDAGGAPHAQATASAGASAGAGNDVLLVVLAEEVCVAEGQERLERRLLRQQFFEEGGAPLRRSLPRRLPVQGRATHDRQQALAHLLFPRFLRLRAFVEVDGVEQHHTQQQQRHLRLPLDGVGVPLEQLLGHLGAARPDTELHSAVDTRGRSSQWVVWGVSQHGMVLPQ